MYSSFLVAGALIQSANIKWNTGSGQRAFDAIEPGKDIINTSFRTYNGKMIDEKSTPRVLIPTHDSMSLRHHRPTEHRERTKQHRYDSVRKSRD